LQVQQTFSAEFDRFAFLEIQRSALIQSCSVLKYLCFDIPRGIAHWALTNLSRFWMIIFVGGGKYLFEISCVNICQMNILWNMLELRKVYYLGLAMNAIPLPPHSLQPVLGSYCLGEFRPQNTEGVSGF
jgi:hypothetical protein